MDRIVSVLKILPQFRDFSFLLELETALAQMATKAPKRCHYEVLELARTATFEEIKAAYRRLALVHHPDKNGGSVESTERFRVIQTAYAVLTDTNEKAWYDRHREDIMREDDGDDSERLVNLFSFFSADCYDSFDDSPRGFYAVFADVFRRIVAEEARYAEQELPSTTALPEFGDSETSGSSVLSFYAAWQNFTSRLSFSWEDVHNPLEAPNRNVRRAMEKENKKLRDSARRERTEGVRALVSYCQRRDKRYLLILVETRRRAEEVEAQRKAALLERQRAAAEARAALAEEHARETAARELAVRASGAYRLADDDGDGTNARRSGGGRKRAALEAARQVPGLVVRAELAIAPAQEAGEDDDVKPDDDADALVYLCEVCDKSFRSAAALSNHEQSKKHLRALRSLGLQPPSVSGSAGATETLEEAVVVPVDAADCGPTSSASTSSHAKGAEAADAEAASPRLKQSSTVDAAASRTQAVDQATASDSDSEADGGAAVVRAAFARCKLQSSPSLISPTSSLDAAARAVCASPPGSLKRDGAAVCGDTDSDSDDAGGGGASKKAKKKAARAAARKMLLAETLQAADPPAAAASSKGVSADAEGPVAQSSAKVRKSRRAPRAERAPPPPIEGSVASLLASVAAPSGRAAEERPTPRRPLNIAGEGFGAGDTLCAVCQERFETRNALFAHIRSTGHAALREDGGGASSSRAARKAARPDR